MRVVVEGEKTLPLLLVELVETVEGELVVM
jgi:hypothetical protein